MKPVFKAVGKGLVPMENARSLASRFSGLLLFLLSLAVVGVLVYLTITSARDQDAADNQVTTQSENQDENAVTSTDSGQAAEDNSSQTSDTSTDADGNGNVAAETDNGLPNTGPESTIAGAIGLAALAGAASSFVSSKRQLQAQSRR